MALAELAVALGLPVFPCRADKRPITENGFKDATRDPDLVRRLFSRPGADLIGVPMGEASGLVAVDIDPRHGGDAWLEENELALPLTREHRTPGGGVHLIFKAPEGVDIRNSAGKLGQGVDVRGTGGYICWYPPGETVAPPAEMPRWLVRACLPVDRSERAPVDRSPRHITWAPVSEGGTRYALAALSRECGAIANAADGQKHATLNKAAYSIGGLVSGGDLDEGVAREALTDAVAAIQHRCDDYRAALKCLDTAFTAGLNRPRDVPEDRAYEPDYGPDLSEPVDTAPAPAPERPMDGIIPLGHDQGVYYYLSQRSGQVVALSAAQHNKNNLMGLASLPHYWESKTHLMGRGGVMWDAAASELTRQCWDVGIYNPALVRGRGAWIDGERSVLHAGDRLIVDGASSGLMLDGSRHVYQQARRMIDELAAPLSTAEAHKLVPICQGLRWDVGISGTLLAGWIALAPVCGGLSWRPSIWITGGAGSGKSTALDSIIRPALGGVSLQVQSKTSEAGLRQMLGSDARPVLFDEAEAEDSSAAFRMQGVLDLVRQSSSDGGAEIVKGAIDGRARTYRIRSVFCFSSINTSVLHEADAGRITTLALRPPPDRVSAEDEATFLGLNRLAVDTLTPSWSSGLVARSVRLLPVIRENAAVFSRAVTIHLGKRRTGDQYGALLAGAYSLHSDRAISDDEALEWVRKQDWSVAADSEVERDEWRCLSYLTQHRLRISGGGNTAGLQLTVGECIMEAFGLAAAELTAPVVADRELRSIGIKPVVAAQGVWVSNSHPYLRGIFAGTPWAQAHAGALARLPAARRSAPKTEHFGPGHKAKAVWLPIQCLRAPG